MDLVNWALRTSRKFTTGVKYQFHKVFDQIGDPEIPITLRPRMVQYSLKMYFSGQSRLLTSLEIEREKLYPGPGLEPGPLALRADALIN